MIALSPPLEQLVVTPHGYYGAPRPLRGGVHQGLDFRAEAGELVVAAATGTVRSSPPGVGYDLPVAQGGGGGGHFVITSHVDAAGERFDVGYMHLERAPVVLPGQVVAAGDVLGQAGATGTSDGAAVHLHFQVNHVVGAQKAAVDPTSYLAGSIIGAPRASRVGRVAAGVVAFFLGWRYLL